MFKRLTGAVIGLLLAAQPISAQEARLRSVRVSAPDVQRTATFYEQAFGLREARRIDRNGALFEIIMNYGATAEAADAATTPRVVVILRSVDAPAPSVSNLIFGVKNLDAQVAKAVAAGGVLSRPINKSSPAASRVAFVKDPAGNEIELIEEAAK
jgi:predicted enzyme related to lactoylglutathione lyase